MFGLSGISDRTTDLLLAREAIGGSLVPMTPTHVNKTNYNNYEMI